MTHHCRPQGKSSEGDWDKSIALNTRATGILISYIAPLCWANRARRSSLMIPPHAVLNSLAHMAPPKPRKSRWPAVGKRNRLKPAPTSTSPPPHQMPTGLRARFYPGEDRTPLADPHEEAAKILAEL